MNGMRKRTVAAAAAAMCVVAGGGPAWACINGVVYETDETVKLVAQAERALQLGRAELAFRKATEVVIMLEEGHEVSGKSPTYVKKQGDRVRPRALRALAVALLRGGEVACKSTKSKPCWAATDAYGKPIPAKAWAQATLADQYLANTGDVTLRALQAEALASKPDPQAALAMLRPMAQADLLPDAHAWALLARLEHELGQPAARDAAVARCQAMVKKAHHKRCLVGAAVAGQG